jgi:hypothetical protein
MTTPRTINAARVALEAMNAPQDAFATRRPEIVAQHLAEVDGEVVVVGRDGEPRTRPSLLTGLDEPFPITALIEELLYRLTDARAPRSFREAHRGLRWK